MLVLRARHTVLAQHRRLLPNRVQRRSMSVVAGTQIKGKTIVVTGARQGIGLELTKQLVGKGNKVIAAARTSSPELDRLQSQGSVVFTPVDFSIPKSIETWAETLAKQEKHLDYVINNAGVYGRRIELEEFVAEDFLFAFQTNAVGPFLVVQQLLKQCLIGPPGTVVANVTSKMGSIEDNHSGGAYAYRASKNALNIISKSLAVDLADKNITTVLLHPGYVKTSMTSGQGYIDAQTSAAGLLSVLESKLPLNGKWYDFASKEIPW